MSIILLNEYLAWTDVTLLFMLTSSLESDNLLLVARCIPEFMSASADRHDYKTFWFLQGRVNAYMDTVGKLYTAAFLFNFLGIPQAYGILGQQHYAAVVSE